MIIYICKHFDGSILDSRKEKFKLVHIIYIRVWFYMLHYIFCLYLLWLYIYICKDFDGSVQILAKTNLNSYTLYIYLAITTMTTYLKLSKRKYIICMKIYFVIYYITNIYIYMGDMGRAV